MFDYERAEYEEIFRDNTIQICCSDDMEYMREIAAPDGITRHTIARRTPHTLKFDESERGKTVYIALAWQNGRGVIGVWSEIQSARMY